MSDVTPGLHFEVVKRSFAVMTHHTVTANGVDCGGHLREERALVQRNIIEEAISKLIAAGVLRLVTEAEPTGQES